MSGDFDLDRAFLLLSVAEKAALHGPKYQWIATRAMDELTAMHPDAQPEKGPSDGE